MLSMFVLSLLPTKRIQQSPNVEDHFHQQMQTNAKCIKVRMAKGINHLVENLNSIHHSDKDPNSKLPHPLLWKNKGHVEFISDSEIWTLIYHRFQSVNLVFIYWLGFSFGCPRFDTVNQQPCCWNVLKTYPALNSLMAWGIVILDIVVCILNVPWSIGVPVDKYWILETYAMFTDVLMNQFRVNTSRGQKVEVRAM